MNPIKQQTINLLNKLYTEDSIADLVDNEINSGNWVSDDDLDEDYPTIEDYYAEHNNREAEDAVRDEVQNTILNLMDLTGRQYLDQAQEEIWETIGEVFTQLDT